MLFVLLPPLVFEAAWNIDIATKRAGALRIVLLAFSGTLLTAIAVDRVFATVLATLVIQGILLEPILRRISGEGSASLA